MSTAEAPVVGEERRPSSSLRVEGLAELWERTLGDPAITIAVLDGPCDLNHPCFTGASIRQMDFIGAGSAEGPAGHHGTHVASILFGQHDSPVKGIAPKCRGLVVPIFRDGPLGSISRCTQPDLARAIRAAANSGANVINISAGQFSHTGTAHPVLAEAIQECRDQGRLIISAAGNDGCPCLHVPGALPSVLAVGAMDADGSPLEFSNWGSNYQLSGILAPGIDILGALPGNRVARRTGTSFATPIVSGIAGLLLSLQKQQRQPPHAPAIRAALLDTAVGCQEKQIPDCRRLLVGRLSVSRALSAIVGTSPLNQVATTSNNNKEQTMPNSPNPMVASASGPQTSEPASLAPARPAPPDTLAPEPNGLVLSASEQPLNGRTTEGRMEPSMERPLLATGRRPTPPDPGPSESAATGRAGVSPSECSCQHAGDLVFALGGLTVDFGTLARLDSIQQNADTYDAGSRLNIRRHSELIRHLVGWKETYKPGGKEKEKVRFHKAHLHDAKDLIWVLTQDESPIYAIKPPCAYTEDSYYELMHFFMEHEGYADDHQMLPDGEKNRGPGNLWYHPSLDTVEGKEPGVARDKDGRVVRLIDRVAIPGRISGSVRLLNGMVLPVINPNMRGTRSWKLSTLIKLRLQLTDKEEDKEELQRLETFLQRFFEEARNTGISGEDRARNFAATIALQLVPIRFRKGSSKEGWELDSVPVSPSPTCRVDSECYDVDVTFFNPGNVLEAKEVWRYTVDVSDEVPVLLGDPRTFRTR